MMWGLVWKVIMACVFLGLGIQWILSHLGDVEEFMFWLGIAFAGVGGIFAIWLLVDVVKVLPLLCGSTGTLPQTQMMPPQNPQNNYNNNNYGGPGAPPPNAYASSYPGQGQPQQPYPYPQQPQQPQYNQGSYGQQQQQQGGVAIGRPAQSGPDYTVTPGAYGSTSAPTAPPSASLGGVYQSTGAYNADKVAK